MGRFFILVCLGLSLLLTFRLWYGEGGAQEAIQLTKKVKDKKAEIFLWKTRNNALEIEIGILKKYPEAVEEQARYELGMIKSGETYCQLVEPLE